MGMYLARAEAMRRAPRRRRVLGRWGQGATRIYIHTVLYCTIHVLEMHWLCLPQRAVIKHRVATRVDVQRKLTSCLAPARRVASRAESHTRAVAGSPPSLTSSVIRIRARLARAVPVDIVKAPVGGWQRSPPTTSPATTISTKATATPAAPSATVRRIPVHTVSAVAVTSAVASGAFVPPPVILRT